MSRRKHQRRHVPVITGYARTLARGEFEGLHWTVLMRMDRRDVLAPIRKVLWNLGMVAVRSWFRCLDSCCGPWDARGRNICTRSRRVASRGKPKCRCGRARHIHGVIVETALDAIIVMDAGGFITDWNVQAEKMFGWPRQEAIGRLLSATIIPAQHREAHERGLRHFLATGEGPILKNGSRSRPATGTDRSFL